jgi:ABC-type Fe3+/spermidine/putrescine transport system ATPase subunit
MSGGEQQRIALARALVIKPSVLLLDEPLAALDKQIRQSMQLELLEVQRATGVTALFVTHDQEEAMALSNRIVVMRSGKVEQIGTPSQIYHQPANKFVASFIGRSNFLDAEIVGSRGETVEARLANGAIVTANAQGFAPRDKVTLALRPENISLKLNGEADRTSKLVGTVVTALDLGPVSQVVVEVSGVGRLEVSLPGPPGARGTGPVASGTAAGLEWGPENMTVLKS